MNKVPTGKTQKMISRLIRFHKWSMSRGVTSEAGKSQITTRKINPRLAERATREGGGDPQMDPMNPMNLINQTNLVIPKNLTNPMTTAFDEVMFIIECKCLEILI